MSVIARHRCTIISCYVTCNVKVYITSTMIYGLFLERLRYQMVHHKSGRGLRYQHLDMCSEVSLREEPQSKARLKRT